MNDGLRLDSCRSAQQEELKNFLRARRARIKPQDVGLQPLGVRRTPGLRREEVAARAGVGVSWYTWLEQGRDINASGAIIDAICRALLLDGTDRVYLYHLVGLGQPPAGNNTRRTTADTARLVSAVDGWMPWPAYVIDIAWATASGERNGMRPVPAQIGPRQLPGIAVRRPGVAGKVRRPGERATCDGGQVPAGTCPTQERHPTDYTAGQDAGHQRGLRPALGRAARQR